MSTDPEASPFEEALRADLPSTETEARLRRRLLAAGLAIGNGVAATTAAAAGTATTGAASGGVVANALGLSWGIKLGFAAAVAIPTLGLLIDESEPAPSAARAPSAVSAVAPRRAIDARVAPPSELEVSEPLPPSEPAPRLENPSSPRLTPRRSVSPSDVAPAIVAPPTPELAPSERAFAAPPEAPVEPKPSKTTLAEETRLLDAAFAALAAGNRVRAAQLIAEHESHYPRGLLTKERERAKTRLSELSRGD